MQAEKPLWPSRDPNIPHPGRIFYGGQWHTPEAVEKRREARRRYYGQNSENERERHRHYWEQNRERELKRQRLYREQNLKKERERCRRYREQNPEKERERKARRMRVGGQHLGMCGFTQAEREAMLSGSSE